MSLVVVGSVALDSIFTPFGETADALGGSAVYFSVAASLLHPVKVVGVVGKDYPLAELERLGARGIDWSGVEHADGESFRWKGKYSYDLQSRETLETRLGVFAHFQPKLPAAFRSAKYLFLGNIDPELQLGVLEQIERPELVVCDTMNYWIQEQEGCAAGAAPAGGRADGERRRGARALRRLEHPPRGALDPGARPEAGRDQAGRVRGASPGLRPHVLRAGLSARGGVRPHRGGRRVRRWLHGLHRAHPGPGRREPAAGDGLRRGHGVVRGLAFRYPRFRRGDDRRCRGPGARLPRSHPRGAWRNRYRRQGRGPAGPSYAAAGVDLAAADDAKERIGRLVAGTRTALSVGHVGAFGGMVRVPAGMRTAGARAQHRRGRHQGAGRHPGRRGSTPSARISSTTA